MSGTPISSLWKVGNQVSTRVRPGFALLGPNVSVVPAQYFTAQYFMAQYFMAQYFNPARNRQHPGGSHENRT
jgi:hypothetical protein